AGAFLIEPAELLRAAQEDATQNQPLHALRMRLRIGQRQGGAPGAAKQHESVDAQMLTNALDIGDQRLGGIVLQARVRGGTTAAALIEGDNAIQGRIEVTATGGIAAGAGTTMNEQHRQPVRRATLVDVQNMRWLDRQLMACVGFDLRIQSL